MFPYILTFILSFIFLKIATKTKRKKSLPIILSVIPLIILAALRSDKIGTDMHVYIMPIFETACNYTNLSDFIENSGVEYLYSLFTFLSTRISKSPELYLGVMNAFVVLPVTYSAYKLKNYSSILMVVFLFCMYMYNNTLNMQRQGIALSFSFLSLAYYIERKYIKGLIALYIGFLFHSSAVIGISIPFLFWFTGKYPFKKYKFLYIIILFSSIAVLISLVSIGFYLINIGVLPEKYIIYITDSVFDAGLSSTDLVYRFFVLFIVILARKDKSKDSHLLDFFLVVSLVDIIASLSGLIISFLTRISLYTTIVSYFSLAYCSKINGRYNNIISVMVVSMYILYWVYMYGIAGVSATMPYSLR